MFFIFSSGLGNQQGQIQLTQLKGQMAVFFFLNGAFNTFCPQRSLLLAVSPKIPEVLCGPRSPRKRTPGGGGPNDNATAAPPILLFLLIRVKVLGVTLCSCCAVSVAPDSQLASAFPVPIRYSVVRRGEELRTEECRGHSGCSSKLLLFVCLC